MRFEHMKKRGKKLFPVLDLNPGPYAPFARMLPTTLKRHALEKGKKLDIL